MKICSSCGFYVVQRRPMVSFTLVPIRVEKAMMSLRKVSEMLSTSRLKILTT